jgi:hypothetical protein
METEQETNIPKSQYWQDHIKGWKESGQTRTAYCSQNSLQLTTFDYWRRKLREPTGPIKMVQVPTPGRMQMNSAGIRLIVNQHYLIEVENGFCPSTLSQLLKVVQGL